MSASLAHGEREDALRVGIDATTWTNGRGFGRHTRSVIPALLRVDPATRYTLFVDSPAGRDAVPAGAAVRVVTGRPRAAADRRRLGDVVAMSRALADPAFDVLLFPAVASYVPVVSRARKVVTFHDVIAETFPALALGGRPARVLWHLKIALARRQADAILTPSEFARRGLVAHFGFDPARVFVLGSGTAPAFRLRASAAPTPALRALGLGTGARAIVYVGGFSPHKRLDLLVDVFADLVARTPDVRLVLVGDYERDGFQSAYPAIRERVRRLGLDAVVTFTGFLADDDLAVLLNLATVLALPSMMEGFGLPAFEAAACGCPVVATSASPIPELLGECALAVRPGDRDDLGRALRQVLDDGALRAKMRAAAPAAAAPHTWDGAAERVAAVIRQVARA